MVKSNFFEGQKKKIFQTNFNFPKMNRLEGNSLVPFEINLTWKEKVDTGDGCKKKKIINNK